VGGIKKKKENVGAKVKRERDRVNWKAEGPREPKGDSDSFIISCLVPFTLVLVFLCCKYQRYFWNCPIPVLCCGVEKQVIL